MSLFLADGEPFDLALKAYQRWCQAKNALLNQPSESDSDWDGDVYVLQNANGELARLTWDGSRFSVIED